MSARAKMDLEGGPRPGVVDTLKPRPAELKGGSSKVGITDSKTAKANRQANPSPSPNAMPLLNIRTTLPKETPLLLVDRVSKPPRCIGGEEAMNRHGRKDRLDKHSVTTMREHTSSPPQKLAIHLIQDSRIG